MPREAEHAANDAAATPRRPTSTLDDRPGLHGNP
jgi:hypothetical protein